MRKKIYSASVLILTLILVQPCFSQISYTMVPGNPGYTPLSGGDPIGDLASGSDLTITAPLPIGFNFVFDGTTYTEFQASDNGYIHFGNDLGPTGYGNAGGDVIIPNDFTDATGSTPGINTMRPFVAPLWEELAIAGIGGGGASYLTSGVAPNRTLTVEWDRVSWRAPTATNQISFQVVLHETTNIIDFIYLQGPVALGNLPTASIGLAGINNGDYYSLSDSGPNPTVSKTVNTTTINTKPATGQMYRWIPSVATGIKSTGPRESLTSVYSDPVSNNLKVSGIFSEEGTYEFEVMSLLGQVIYKDKIQVTNTGLNTFEFMIPSSSRGIYIARVSGQNISGQIKFTRE